MPSNERSNRPVNDPSFSDKTKHNNVLFRPNHDLPVEALFTQVVETTVEHEDDPTRPEAMDPAVATNSRPTSALALPVRCPLPPSVVGMDPNPNHHRHLVLDITIPTIPTATALKTVVVVEQKVILLVSCRVAFFKTKKQKTCSLFFHTYVQAHSPTTSLSFSFSLSWSMMIDTS